MDNRKTIIIKIGGSVLSPSQDNLFDFDAAENIKNVLLPLTNEYKFILICGGGGLARLYQSFVDEQNGSNKDKDWIGTESCNMNATMLRIVLGEDICEDIPLTGQALNLESSIKITKSFLCVGAADPGHSSDYNAVIIAKRTGAKRILSLKNVDGVYSEDPNKNPDAEKFENLSWGEYKQIIKVEEFTPKLALPVDPIATKEAELNSLEFVILDGSDTDNLINAIVGNSFVGTTISN